jgi:hypothetical protein
MKNNKSMKNNY